MGELQELCEDEEPGEVDGMELQDLLKVTSDSLAAVKEWEGPRS